MTNTSTTDRNTLRGAILSGTNTRKKTLKLQGQDIELRHLTIDELMKLGTTAGAERFAKTLIVTACIPNTTELLFEDADMDVLKQLPWSAEIQAIQEFFNEMFIGDVDTAEKN